MSADLKAPEAPWEWKGEPDAPVLVAGHSHCNAYQAAVTGGLTPDGVRLRFLVPSGPTDSGAPLQPDYAYWRAARRAPCRVLAVVWQGNQHNEHFLFDFDPPLRLHDHGDRGRVLPASMISALYEESLDQLEALVSSAKAERTVILGTPPPKSDAEIRAGLLREPLLLRAAAAVDWDASTMRITPAAVRIGMWKILQADLESKAARLGALYVGVPAEAQTPDGCLKREYSWADATHANGAFGVLMLAKLEEALAAAEAA